MVPAQRALEHALSRTERFAELASILRLQAATYETKEARLGAVSELILVEDHRGLPRCGAPAATDSGFASFRRTTSFLTNRFAKGHCSRVEKRRRTRAASLLALASSTVDVHHAATFELVAALVSSKALKRRTNDAHRSASPLRNALEGWPECLNAARGLRRPPSAWANADALTEASVALGSLEIDAAVRAERLVEAAEAFAGRESHVARSLALSHARSAKIPIARAAQGLLTSASSAKDPGLLRTHAASPRRATQTDQVVRPAPVSRSSHSSVSDTTVAVEACDGFARKLRQRTHMLNLAEACASMKLWVRRGTARRHRNHPRPARALKATLLLAIAEVEMPGGQASASRDAAAAEKLVESIPSEARSEIPGAPRIGLHGRRRSSGDLACLAAGGPCTVGKSPSPSICWPRPRSHELRRAPRRCPVDSGILERANGGNPDRTLWIVDARQARASVLSKTREGIASLKKPSSSTRAYSRATRRWPR